MFTKSSPFRMSQWLIFSVLLYAVAILMARFELLPQLQTIFWKLGHETIAAFVGYWIDRAAFKTRLTDNSDPLLHIRRAILIAATMISVALGL